MVFCLVESSLYLFLKKEKCLFVSRQHPIEFNAVTCEQSPENYIVRMKTKGKNYIFCY